MNHAPDASAASTGPVKLPQHSGGLARTGVVFRTRFVPVSISEIVESSRL